MTILAAQLIGRTQVPVMPSKMATEHNDYRWANHNFTNKKIVIDKAQKYAREILSVVYSDGKQLVTAMIPDSFEFNEVKDTEIAKEMLAKAVKVKMQNLDRILASPGYFIGSDPEMFVEDENGIVIPAFDFLGSNKKPDKTAGMAENHGANALYWDGYQAEFQTHAIQCLGWQVDSVQHGLAGLLKKAKAFNKNARLAAKTVMEIPAERLQNDKDEHVDFGCMPSKNAYGIVKERRSGREVNFRPAGGHIHFGIGKLDKLVYQTAVKAMDAILAVACVSLFETFDDVRRRTMYGLAGEYRTPAHGLEYRVLSNAWLFHPLIMNLVFDLARKALAFGRTGLLPYWEAKEEETITAIQDCDAKLARKILRRNKTAFSAIAGSSYGYPDEALYDVFANPMEEIIENPTDIEGNWKLTGFWKSHSGGPGASWQLAKGTILAKSKV